MFDDSLDRSLCKNSINLVIKDRTHKAGIDVEILNILDFDSIVFVWVKKKVQARTSEYLSLSFSLCLWKVSFGLGL